MQTKSIGPFLGINNRVPDYELADVERGRKVGDYLRNAVNVDLTKSGTLQLRKGFEVAVPGGQCHSLWSDGVAGYYVDDNTLFRFPRTVIRTGLQPDLRVSYATGVKGELFWSNGVDLEVVTGGNSRPLGLPPLNPLPSLSASATGSLPQGQYQFCFTRVAPDGSHSGASWPQQLLVPENGRIEIAGLPGDEVAVFMSPHNGDVLLYLTTTSQTSLSVHNQPTLGYQVQTFGLKPPPAGQIVRWHHGRLLVARGDTLFYSEPFAPALHNPIRGYIPFPARITVVEPFDEGIYVVADETYWLAGRDVDKCEVTTRLPYGAAEGSAMRDPIRDAAWWYSDRGLVMADAEGVKNVQEGNVAVPGVKVGASLFREQDGIRQIITTTLGGAESTVAAASSFIEAEVVRKESMQ